MRTNFNNFSSLCYSVAHHKFSIGLAIGWLAPTLKSLQDPHSEVPLTLQSASSIASLHQLGRCIGSLSTIFLMSEIGRKVILICSASIFFAIWFGILLIKSISALYIIQIIFGVGVGMYDVVAPIYLGENCPTKFKGTFTKVIDMSFYTGILIQFIMASYLSYNTVAVINLLNAFLGLLGTVFLKESVHFLLQKDNVIDAQKNFIWFKGEFDWDVISTEFNMIKTNIEEQRNYQGCKSLLTWNNHRNVALVLIFFLASAALGYEAIMVSATIIFPSNSPFSSTEYTIFFGVVLWIVACVSYPINDRYAYKSRLLVLISFYCLSIFHISSAYFYYKSLTELLSTWYPLLTFFCISFSSLAYILLNSALCTVKEELFAESFEMPGASLIVMIQSCTSFVIIKIFLLVGMYYGFHVIFSAFAIVSLIMFIFTYVVFFSTCVPNGEFV